MAWLRKYHCESCKYFEHDGDENSKGYCSWYKSYYYPDDSCDHWDD